VPPAPVATEPNAASDPATRLRDLERRLAAKARELERQRDSRCVFTHAYALMTRRIAAELTNSSFADPGWIVALAETFAARYAAALDAWDAGEELAPAWGDVFETICSRRTSVLEDLVLAMAAHIMRDLPHSLLDVGLEASDGSSRIADFHTINDVLGTTIDDIQDEVGRRYARYFRSLDRVGRGYDEMLTNYGVRVSRGLAWYNARRLADPRSSEDAVGSIERSPIVFAHEVMNPPLRSLRVFLRALRWCLGHLRRWPGAHEAGSNTA
jgi:Family of unknown function (DUF5995)